MFSYQHVYHVGNHADVLKHIVLVQLLSALRRKEKPFFVLDTHAGEGIYALDDARAKRLGEFREGVARLWGTSGLHPAIDEWLGQVKVENPTGELQRYPGSPRLIARQLRPQDKFIAVEGHPEAFAGLRRALQPYAGAYAEQGDAWRSIKAYLPPDAGRGLILIDPSYETRAETAAIERALKLINKRFRQGIVAVWYPLLPHKPLTRWLEALAAAGIADILLAELRVSETKKTRGLYGSGMLVVNPPWGLAQALSECLPFVHSRLSAGGHGGCCVRTLVDERGRAPE